MPFSSDRQRFREERMQSYPESVMKVARGVARCWVSGSYDQWLLAEDIALEIMLDREQRQEAKILPIRRVIVHEPGGDAA